MFTVRLHLVDLFLSPFQASYSEKYIFLLCDYHQSSVNNREAD